jgi:uncharacterized protein (DUF1330 family)
MKQKGTPMKAYWIARVEITDPEPYARYAEAAGPAFKAFGARILVRGGHAETLEGQSRPRNVVIEFDSMDKALACYNSAEYQAAREHRVNAGINDLIIVEGVE